MMRIRKLYSVFPKYNEDDDLHDAVIVTSDDKKAMQVSKQHPGGRVEVILYEN